MNIRNPNTSSGTALPGNSRAFSLIELIVSMTVLAVLMLIISSVVGTVQRSWRSTNAKVSQFREARRAFDVLKRNLTQATLNTYLRYRYSGTGDPYSPFGAGGVMNETATPTGYEPFSELQFICGPTADLITGGGIYAGHATFFQAILGFSSEFPNLPTSLNARGYFVEFGDDTDFRPDFLTGRVRPKFRYRLMEYAPTTEENLIYDSTSRNVQGDWFARAAAQSRPVAENVIALFISPKRPQEDRPGDTRDIAPLYQYDSTRPSGALGATVGSHELPPQIELIMVVIDEASASRLAEINGDGVPFNLNGFTMATDATLRNDLANLRDQLLAAKVDYRIFSSTVSLNNSKWKG
jgi:uncharacterized protein (TIGR02599 family)